MCLTAIYCSVNNCCGQHTLTGNGSVNDPQKAALKLKISIILDVVLLLGLIFLGILGLTHAISIPSEVSWVLVATGGTTIGVIAVISAILFKALCFKVKLSRPPK